MLMALVPVAQAYTAGKGASVSMHMCAKQFSLTVTRILFLGEVAIDIEPVASRKARPTAGMRRTNDGCAQCYMGGVRTKD